MASDSCDNVYFVDSYQGNVWKIPTALSVQPSCVAIPLRPGWNLVSLPLVPNNPSIIVVLSSQIAHDEVLSVWTYSASSDSWLSFTPGKASTLPTMIDGNGYWIDMRTSDTLDVHGSVIVPLSTPPTYTLTQGWNLVGFKPQPAVQNETVTQYLSSINGNYDQNDLWLYDNSSGAWIRATASAWLQLGQAIWIFVTSPATLRP